MGQMVIHLSFQLQPPLMAVSFSGLILAIMVDLEVAIMCHTVLSAVLVFHNKTNVNVLMLRPS